MKTAETWRCSDVECECPYCGEVDVVGDTGTTPETWPCKCGKEYKVGEVEE